MIKTLLSFGFFLCVGLSYGQQVSKKPLKQISVDQKAPALTKEMEQYAVSNGSFITATVTKDEPIAYVGEISMEIAKKVNPADMGIKITDNDQYYKITGTNQMLVVKSTWALDGEMKMSKK